jgi:hypothetical protein
MSSPISTLCFLPARGKHGPAMIAAFGIAHESEAGVLAIDDSAVRGVHITRLAPDGLGKAGTDHDKIMVGRSVGWPIVLAPPNDLGGLVIAEGVENALSAFEATGCGAWASGCASRLPALADAVPAYIESVSILVDGDETGRRNSRELADRLLLRKIEVRLVAAAVMRRPAAS